MVFKRDRVNRFTGLVHLPIDGSSLVRGQRVSVRLVKEEPIDCAVRDAMAMREPRDGNAIGDALFDAQTPVRVLGGISRGRLVAFCTENGKYLGTTNSISTNVCDADAL